MGMCLAGRGVGWLPWAAADSSHCLYPEGWSHTDRATYAVWWGWSGWCGDVAAPVDTEGLAARAGPVSRAPQYVGTDTPASRNRTPPRRLSTSR